MQNDKANSKDEVFLCFLNCNFDFLSLNFEVDA